MNSTQKLSAAPIYTLATVCIMRKEPYATEMTELPKKHESHSVVHDCFFVSHGSVLAGGETDICRWAAGKVELPLVTSGLNR